MSETYSFDGVKEPVFIKNSDLLKEKWLVVTQKDEFSGETRPIVEILADPLPPMKKICFELLDTCLYKCKKCCATVQGGEKPPEVCPQCDRPSDFSVITESMDVPKNIWNVPIWEDVDLDMFETYDRLVSLLKSTIRFVNPIEYKLFALWIVATYKHPLWETIPYLHFRGLPASGKTRAMEVANRLAYRCVLVSGITFKAVVRINHNYNVSLCIDEVDTKLDDRTEGGREYIDFLKSGYKKGSLYISSDLNDQKKILYYNNYGPKVLSGEKGIRSEALLSRTIIFDMEQDYPEVFNLSEIECELSQLRTRLMNWRFKTRTPEQIGIEIDLRARFREIFDCLIRTGQAIGQPIDDIIAYAKSMEQQAISDMQGTIGWDVLTSIFELSCKGSLDAVETIKFSDIMDRLGWNDEDKRKNAQKLGYILKDFGIKSKKKKDGTYISLVDPATDRKLNYLFKRYKVSGGE